MKYKEFLKKDVRLRILQLLYTDTNYALNTGVLQVALGGYGHSVSSDMVLTQGAWLEEQGLITRENLPMEVIVFTITHRGCDVVLGNINQPNVMRPNPTEINECKKLRGE